MIFVGVMRKTCRSRVDVLHTCGGAAPVCVLATGAPLWTILRAGEWRSPAFLTYLDLHLCACAPLRVFPCSGVTRAAWQAGEGCGNPGARG